MQQLTHSRTAQVAIAWAAAEGWNPGLDDGQRFLAADPAAFLGTARDGEVVASVSCALYGPGYAFIGFYIIRPDLRARPRTAAVRPRAGGPTDAWSASTRCRSRRPPTSAAGSRRRTATSAGGCAAAGRGPPASSTCGPCRPASWWPPTPRSSAPSAAASCAPGPFAPPGHALAYVRDGAVAGYGWLRACRTGAKIGPLLADDVAAADALLTGLLAAAGPDTEVFIDMPTANPATRELRATRSIEPVFETARMYLHGEPLEDLHRIFGVTTLEFG